MAGVQLSAFVSFGAEFLRRSGLTLRRHLTIFTAAHTPDTGVRHGVGKPSQHLPQVDLHRVFRRKRHDRTHGSNLKSLPGLKYFSIFIFFEWKVYEINLKCLFQATITIYYRELIFVLFTELKIFTTEWAKL